MSSRRVLAVSQERLVYDDNASEVSPLTQSPSAKHLIPQGTVSTRVSHLQNPSSLCSPTRLDGPYVLGREHRHVGYGRRQSSRFAKPASRNSDPSLTSHSFVGLNSQRTGYKDAYAWVNKNPNWYRAPGVHAQIQPDGYNGLVQTEAASTYKFVSKSKSCKNIQEIIDHQNDGIALKKNKSDSRLRDLSKPPIQLQPHPVLTPTAPDETISKADPRSKRRRRSALNVHHVSNDLASAETTSTIRRKSVRDLFKDYGIERPQGLASSEDVPYAELDRVFHDKKFRYCHICEWVNGPRGQCEKCQHLLCVHCQELIPGQTATDDDVDDQVRGQYFERPPLAPNQTLQRPALRNNFPLAIATSAIPPPKQSPALPSDHHMSPDRPNNLQTFNKTVQKHSGNILETPKVPFKTLNSVKSSPFLLADALRSASSAKKPNATIHLTLQRSHGSHKNHHKNSTRVHHNNYANHSDPISEASSLDFTHEPCESAGCRATHEGHRPYRHSISCSRRALHENDIKRETHITKNSVCARQDFEFRSHFQLPKLSAAIVHSRPCQSQEFRDRRNALHRKQVDDHVLPANVCDLAKSQNHSTSHASSVKCRGYPRTGHVQHRSPNSSGIVGECQHCLDDCQCEACQSTPHSVRCCVHQDHKATPHYHTTPQRGISIANLSRTISPQPLVLTNEAVRAYYGTHTEAHRRSMSTVLQAPKPRRTYDLPWMKDVYFRQSQRGSSEEFGHNAEPVMSRRRRNIGLSQQIPPFVETPPTPPVQMEPFPVYRLSLQSDKSLNRNHPKKYIVDSGVAGEMQETTTNLQEQKAGSRRLSELFQLLQARGMDPLRVTSMSRRIMKHKRDQKSDGRCGKSDGQPKTVKSAVSDTDTTPLINQRRRFSIAKKLAQSKSTKTLQDLQQAPEERDTITEASVVENRQSTYNEEEREIHMHSPVEQEQIASAQEEMLEMKSHSNQKEIQLLNTKNDEEEMKNQASRAEEVVGNESGSQWDENEELGITAITIIIHMDGKEDLIVRTELK